jgi:hypothetical protein
MASDKAHFCTCGDLKCPLNPNNPANAGKDIGCDACIRKNIALGEVPSCLFVRFAPIPDDWDDFQAEGFAEFIAQHPRTDEERRQCRERAQRFEASYADKPQPQEGAGD